MLGLTVAQAVDEAAIRCGIFTAGPYLLFRLVRILMAIHSYPKCVTYRPMGVRMALGSEIGCPMGVRTALGSEIGCPMGVRTALGSEISCPMGARMALGQ